jgi:hypothetical protein
VLREFILSDIIIVSSVFHTRAFVWLPVQGPHVRRGPPSTAWPPWHGGETLSSLLPSLHWPPSCPVDFLPMKGGG